MKLFYCLGILLCPLLCYSQAILIQGKVVNEQGEPLPAVTIAIKGTTTSTVSDRHGSFSIQVPTATEILLISGIGYESLEVAATGPIPLFITLKQKITELDEAIVIAYGTTTRRINTGSIVKVTAAEIGKQPVTNPLAALSGRVPGMIVTQNSGVSGSAFSVEIRGRSSLDLSLTRNDPLFIIDGVPFESGNIPYNELISAANTPINASTSPPSGLSPLHTINPHDIESIEVLKDADATAIYGSRGANGVILITTKKAQAGNTKIAISMNSGFSKVGRTMDLLNTSQYLEVRREAFANDGITPTAANAPDLVLWDTTKYTDYKDLFIGGTAHLTDLRITISGGNAYTQFTMSGGYTRETNVFPGSTANTRASGQLNIFHTPVSKKWDARLSVIYSSDNNKLFSTDLTRHILLPPHLQLYASDGKYAWEQNGVTFSSLGFLNPLALQDKTYNSIGRNLSANLMLNYQLFRGFILRASAGYNKFDTDETSFTPKSTIAPENSTLASADYANSDRATWIAEPQAEYNTTISKGKLKLLIGSTFQEIESNKIAIDADGYTSDILLGSLAAAGTIRASNSSSLYRYNALFGRIHYNWSEKYIVNISARRDGSSRFGPGKQFANFGALGLAWIFTAEPWLQRVKVLSFGKLRTSFGITGNDQVGDYKYLNLWNSTSNPYQGSSGLRPVGLFNPDYRWEKNKKWEAALELGFFQNRLQLSAAWYRHRSSNQLANYRLPSQSGFTSVVKNLPALIQNSGVEVTAQSTIINRKNFSWKAAMNFTIPKNKLVSFPGLSGSSYSTLYAEGYSLSVLRKYRYTGIDPSTGIYSFEDMNNDGLYSSPDLYLMGDVDPKWYGGLSNTLTYMQWQLDVFAEYRNKSGASYIYSLAQNYPGFLTNQPALVLDRWRKPGDVASVQRYISTPTSPGFQAFARLSASDAAFEDASFARIKTISLSYDLPENLRNKLKLQTSSIYIRAQNLFTITNYKGSDPETANFYQLPPLKTIAVGIQFTF